MKYIKQRDKHIRIILLMISGIIAFAALLYRLFYLEIKQGEFLRAQGDARTVRIAKIPAYRGMIKDRNNEPMAVSTLVKSIWINPKEIVLDHPNFASVCKKLQLNINEIRTKILENSNREFLYLKRHIDPNLAQYVLELEVPGVFASSEYRRFYPAGEVTAHVLGFTDLDDRGKEGLELSYNNILSGLAGRNRIVKDRLGREIEFLESIDEMQPGHDVELSIDLRLQYLAFKELKQAVINHNASSGSAVVLGVNTGEVLAMVNYPSFNPNVRSKNANREHYRNAAVTDYFEPGSAIKSFSVASILEDNTITPTTLVDTSPGKLYLAGGVVSDLQNFGVIDVTDILKKSSNIGIAKFVLARPPQQLWDMYDRLGFGFTTGSNFPGESSGFLTMPNESRPFVIATMSYGYHIGVTALQLARAYAILGSFGVKYPVTFLKAEKSDTSRGGERVMSSQVARKVVNMLAEVSNNNNSKARLELYNLAGKTGTTRELGKNGYDKSRHGAVFGGLAPAVAPKFAIVVTIHDIKHNNYYGNQVSAPVFAKIAHAALRLFNVQPDVLLHGLHMAQVGNSHS